MTDNIEKLANQAIKRINSMSEAELKKKFVEHGCECKPIEKQGYEFKPGDLITVQVYSGNIRCKVRGTTRGFDGTPLYNAASLNGEMDLITTTSGRSIMESRHYVAITEEERAHPFA